MGKKEGYMWLEENFGIRHFSELDHKKDVDKLQRIYDALIIKTILD